MYKQKVKEDGSPGDHLVQKLLLLFAGAGQIDTGGFDIFMSHQVSKQRDIVEFVQEIFSKPVAEGVGVHGIRIDVVPVGKLFQLTVDSPGSDWAAILVQEQKSSGQFSLSAQVHRFFAE